jgi:hypothetical protein
MIKKNTSKRGHDRSSVITTPSAYGSHKSMVVDHGQFNLTLEPNQVLCKDDIHYYITSFDRLDTNLADPNRYSTKSTFVPPETEESSGKNE